MKRVVSAFHPLLKEAGFRKRRYTFNRPAGDDVVHVINFLQGPYDPPAWTEIPGLRTSVYGRFSVNFGVFIESAWQVASGLPATQRKLAVNEYDCQIRRRLVGPDNREPADWWELGDLSAVPRVDGLLRTGVLSWFADFSTSDAIISMLEAQPPSSREVTGIAGVPPDGLLAVYIHLGRRQQPEAEAALQRYLAAQDGEAHPSHREYVEAFAAQHGLRTAPAS